MTTNHDHQRLQARVVKDMGFDKPKVARATHDDAGLAGDAHDIVVVWGLQQQRRLRGRLGQVENLLKEHENLAIHGLHSLHNMQRYAFLDPTTTKFQVLIIEFKFLDV